MRFTQPNDSISVIAGPDINPHYPMYQLPYGEVLNSFLDFGQKKWLRNCDQENKQLTTCLDDFLNQTYGNDVKIRAAKAAGKIGYFVQGITALTNNTKCQRPCFGTEYFVHEANVIKRRFASKLLTATLDRLNDTHSPILMFTHNSKPIIVKNEVLAYSFSSLFGDAGGIIGIAIGASLHSVYEDLVSPLLNNVRKRIRNV